MENDPSLSKQIWYSCHLAASFICFLNLFSMSRCSLNLESNKRRAQRPCFCSRACVSVSVPLGTTPWMSRHHGLAKVPTAWDIHPCSRQGKLCIWVCTKISNLYPKKWRVEHEFPGSHKHLKAYRDFHYYIQQRLYQHQKSQIMFSCPVSTWSEFKNAGVPPMRRQLTSGRGWVWTCEMWN